MLAGAGPDSPLQLGGASRLPGKITRLTLLCHGATQATRKAAFPAGGDPLDPQALRALPRLAQHLARQDACFSSPAACATATAAALDLPFRLEPRLRDCHYGDWIGMTLAEVEQSSPEAFLAWFAEPDARPPGGESLADVALRVGEWLASCASAPCRMLAVTHPLVIRTAVMLALGAPSRAVWRIDVAPLTMTWLTAQNGRWRLIGLNQAP